MLRPFTSNVVLAEAGEHPYAVIYKHSPTCWFSGGARREMVRFATERTDVPVYEIDVIADRGLARDVARALDVPHASPQVILLRGGQVLWTASHGRVRARALAKAIAT